LCDKRASVGLQNILTQCIEVLALTFQIHIRNVVRHAISVCVQESLWISLDDLGVFVVLITEGVEETIFAKHRSY
jgi:predicted ABC-class ATPase